MMALRVTALALAAMVLAPLGQPLKAQALSPELQALEEQLPGALVNDPSRIDWDSYGPEFYAESFQDDAIPGGAARRFHVNQASEFIYAAGTNIPLIRNVSRGDQITIGFYARTVEANTSDGKGVLRVRFQRDAPPYPGFGEQTLEIGTQWDWYEVTAKAEQALRRKDGIVSIQFGRTKQVLEIGQAIVVTGASSIIGGVSEPEPAPAPEPAAAELPGPLKGLGTLLNDPGDRDWGFAASVDSGSIRKVDDNSIWLGKVTNMATTPDDPTAGVDALVNIGSPIKAGEEIQIALAAKSAAQPEPGKGSTLEVRMAVPSAGETLAQSSIELGDNWQLVRVVVTAPRDLRADAPVVGLRITGPGQSVDIGPVYVVRVAKPAQ